MAVVAVSPSLAVAEERGEEVSRFSGKKFRWRWRRRKKEGKKVHAVF